MSAAERCRCGGWLAGGVCDRCAVPALVDRLRALPAAERRVVLGGLGTAELAALRWAWRAFWARPDQLPPAEPWTFWGLIGGRGSGKTETAAQWVRDRVATGEARRLHLIAATYDDARETMVNGVSGLMAVTPPAERPRFLPSVAGGILEWPNGALGRVFSAEEPKRLRGPQCDTLWCDDVAAWGPAAMATWSQAMWGFRLGDPRCVISTTPIASELLRSLIRDGRKGLVIVKSSTDDNRANLARSFFDKVVAEFEGTAMEAQERRGELLEDVAGALFFRRWIEPYRVRREELPELRRIVVAVDPSYAESELSDEVGIVVDALGADGRLYVLADLTGPHTAAAWAKLAVKAFREFRADAIVTEVNRGGALVRRNVEIEAPNVPVRMVLATRGKATRAEPLAHLYERGRVSHVRGAPGVAMQLHRRREPLTLEAEMTGWVPGQRRSPNGLDAHVWGAAELLPFDGDSWEATKPTAAPEEPDAYRYGAIDPDLYRY